MTTFSIGVASALINNSCCVNCAYPIPKSNIARVIHARNIPFL